MNVYFVDLSDDVLFYLFSTFSLSSFRSLSSVCKKMSDLCIIYWRRCTIKDMELDIGPSQVTSNFRQWYKLYAITAISTKNLTVYVSSVLLHLLTWHPHKKRRNTVIPGRENLVAFVLSNEMCFKRYMPVQCSYLPSDYWWSTGATNSPSDTHNIISEAVESASISEDEGIRMIEAIIPAMSSPNSISRYLLRVRNPSNPCNKYIRRLCELIGVDKILNESPTCNVLVRLDELSLSLDTQQMKHQVSSVIGRILKSLLTDTLCLYGYVQSSSLFQLRCVREVVGWGDTQPSTPFEWVDETGSPLLPYMQTIIPIREIAYVDVDAKHTIHYLEQCKGRGKYTTISTYTLIRDMITYNRYDYKGAVRLFSFITSTSNEIDVVARSQPCQTFHTQNELCSMSALKMLHNTTFACQMNVKGTVYENCVSSLFSIVHGGDRSDITCDYFIDTINILMNRKLLDERYTHSHSEMWNSRRTSLVKILSSTQSLPQIPESVILKMMSRDMDEIVTSSINNGCVTPTMNLIMGSITHKRLDIFKTLIDKYNPTTKEELEIRAMSQQQDSMTKSSIISILERHSR
jgi:hypothetical protein